MGERNNNELRVIIHYAVTKAGDKLFSFDRHDYRSTDTGEFIDGGFDYIRTNCEIKTDFVDNLIQDIREQFKWYVSLDKDGRVLKEPKYVLLKDLDTDHIEAILKLPTLVNPETLWAKTYKSIFENELKYRQ